MSKDMLGPVVRGLVNVPREAHGTLIDLFEKLAGQKGEAWLENLNELKKLLRKGCVAKPTYKVLRPVAPKSTEPRPFKANETFFSKSSGVKMVPHGSNFTAWFTGKAEENIPTGDLVPFVLTEYAYDNEIVANLGGEEKAETTLGEIWRLLERQANGEEGVLLTNGYANIFYVRDVNGVLRAVDVLWRGGGWNAYALALGGGGWSGGDRVFSRNS